MAESKSAGRPRARTLVQLDLDNAYAQLGVSPLARTAEIKQLLNERRRKATSARRSRTIQEYGEVEDEVERLDRLAREIGKARKRARYDEAHPQNRLLTVQPDPRNRWVDRRVRADLITAWLVEELGAETLLPTPDSMALWAPRGVDDRIHDFLTRFAPHPVADPEDGAGDDPPAGRGPAPDAPLDASELDALTGAAKGAARTDEHERKSHPSTTGEE